VPDHPYICFHCNGVAIGEDTLEFGLKIRKVGDVVLIPEELDSPGLKEIGGCSPA